MSECTCPEVTGRDWSWTTLVCDVPEQFAPTVDGATSEETSGWGWFTKEEISKLPLHPGFKDAWEAVIRTRKNTELGKCVMRRVGLNGQEFWENPDPCPCKLVGDQAAGGGGPEFMSHDAEGIQDGRASGSRGGGTAGHYDDGGVVTIGRPSPEWEDDSIYPETRAVPPHQGGLLQGYQGGYWPEGGHGTEQAGTWQPVASAPRGVGKAATLSKKSVNYRSATGKRHCGNCVMFDAGEFRCDLVKGKILAQDVCDRWEPGKAQKGVLDEVLANPETKVMAQLLENFPPQALEWVKDAYWNGPVYVPLDRVDFHDETTWAAYHEQDRVEHFKRLITAHEIFNPVVMIKIRGHQHYRVIDGHHRAMAYRELGLAVKAWVGLIPFGLENAALETHSSQYHQGDSKENQ